MSPGYNVSWFEFTGNGYKKVQFHVQGSISNYTARQIVIIKETVAAIVGCDNEEIHLNGFCKSTSFLVVLLMKQRYVNGLFNIKQQDKDKLISLNINYFIVDSNYVYLEKGNIPNLSLRFIVKLSELFWSFNMFSVHRPVFLFDKFFQDLLSSLQHLTKRILCLTTFNSCLF